MTLKDFLDTLPFQLRIGQEFYSKYNDYIVENMKTYIGYKSDVEKLYFIKDVGEAMTLLALIMKRLKIQELPEVEETC